MILEEFIEKQKNLLELERTEEVNQSRILTESSPKTLEEKNLCIRKLSIINICTGLYGRTILEFESKQKKEESSKRVFSQGDIIGIYADSSKSDATKTLATGLFYKSNKDGIQIALDNNFDNDEDFMKDSDSMTFRLVKLSSEVTFSRLKSGLKYLEKRNNPLCGDYLVDLLLGSSSLATTGSMKELNFVNKNLNTSQKEAVNFALSRSDVAIVHGPPGTGKTTVAVEIINQIIESRIGGQMPKILVCTPSNIALDNLAEKLIKSQSDRALIKSKGSKINLVRLGHSARVMPHLTDISLEHKLGNCDQAQLIAQVRAQIDATVKQSMSRQGGDRIRPDRRRDLADLRKELRERELKAVREVLGLSHVVMSTLTGLRSNKSLPLNEIDFDVVLIDEASQAIEVACWLAIPRGRKLILAGDHKQLPPTVLSEKASKEGLGLSLMERLLNLYPGNEITRMLSCQYRMHEDIMRWSSDTFYHADLLADDSVAHHTLSDVFPDTDTDSEPLGALTFIDTAGCDLYELESTQEDSKANLGEAQLAAVYIDVLVRRFNLRPEHIGVITPYSRQVRLIKDAMKNRMESDLKFDYGLVEVSTVDGFQGREKEVILTTLVRSNPTGTIGFLSEHRRLNVALTRAKRHLCVIGDSKTIERSGDRVLRSLVDYWNKTAEVRSAFEYIYEYDISSGDCVKQKTASKPTDSKTNVKSKIEKNDELEKKVCDQLRRFKLNEKRTVLEFPSSLNSRIRAILHELAESLELHHESVGEGANRKLIISKTFPQKSTPMPCQLSPPEIDKNITEKQDSSTSINDEKESSYIHENTQARSTKETLQSSLICENEEMKIEAPILINDVESLKPPNVEKNPEETPEQDNQSSLSILLKSKSASLASAIEKQSSQPGKKSSEIIKKKPNKPKPIKPTVPDVPDDFDEMLEHFQSMDKICQHPEKCSVRVAVLGFNCQFCKKRFCASHAQPEVHFCPLANRTAWRHLDSNPKPMSGSKKIKHGQLSRVINKKLNEMSLDRKPQKKSDEK